MGTPPINEEVGKKVAAAIALADLTAHRVAVRSGIPSSTLHRKLMGAGSFTVDELQRISAVVGVDFVQFLPRREAA